MTFSRELSSEAATEDPAAEVVSSLWLYTALSLDTLRAAGRIACLSIVHETGLRKTYKDRLFEKEKSHCHRRCNTAEQGTMAYLQSEGIGQHNYLAEIAEKNHPQGGLVAGTQHDVGSSNERHQDPEKHHGVYVKAHLRQRKGSDKKLTL